MDGALLELLQDTITITPTGDPVSGGFGARATGAAVPGVPARVGGGTKRLLQPSGREVVAAHTIRIDGAVTVTDPGTGQPRPPRPLDLVALADGTTWEIGAVDPSSDETGTPYSYRLSTAPR